VIRRILNELRDNRGDSDIQPLSGVK